MKKDVIVVDLDGTLCDCTHRQEYARAKQWDQFHSHLTMDKPHEEVANLIKELSANKIILALTGRNEAFRKLTIDWFREHKLNDNVDRLVMRPDEDWRPDHELKIALLEKTIGSRDAVLERVAFVLEDRDKVVEAYRSYGLPCWQVRPGGY